MMSRTLKRVPMDFDLTKGEVWEGYLDNRKLPDRFIFEDCPECLNGFTVEYRRQIDDFRRSMSEALDALKAEDKPWKCPTCDGSGDQRTAEQDKALNVWKDEWELSEPPKGEGFQMWETVTEGSPQTPVFGTLKELAKYCADNCTTFANYTASAEDWEQMLRDGFVSTAIAPGIVAI